MVVISDHFGRTQNSYTVTRQLQVPVEGTRLSTMVMVLRRAMLSLFVLGTLGGTAAWQDCSMSPEDRWVPAGPNGLPARLLDEFHRRYTCLDEQGMFVVRTRPMVPAGMTYNIAYQAPLGPLMRSCATRIGRAIGRGLQI